MDPKYHDKCSKASVLIRDRRKEDTDTERRKPCEDRGRNWNYAAISQEILRPPEAAKARKVSPLEPSR